MFQGIYNENEFYSDHYLHEVLANDLKDLFTGWDELEQNPFKEISSLRVEYLRVLEKYKKAKDFNARRNLARPVLWKIINILGYDEPAANWMNEDSSSQIPLLSNFRRKGDSFDSLILIDIYPDPSSETSLLDEYLLEDQYSEDTPPENKETALTLEELISSVIFKETNPPRWVLLVSLEEIHLIDRSKWGEKRTLRLSLKDIYDYKNIATYRAFCALLQRESLVPGEGESLLDRLNENSHKHAFSVSEDLKYSLREAIELIGNEAVRQLGAKSILEKEEGENLLSKECLRYMYRLLFLFYIEARPELGYAPMKDETYLKGYSLESLRDLADGPEPVNEEEQKGLYLDTSIKMLFKLIVDGTGKGTSVSSYMNNTFNMEPLKSHLFDPENTPLLNKVKFPNMILHNVLELMSLSRKKQGKKSRRGRISYIQLGINQLGAVYEGLLSYRGFIAKEDLFEVKSKGEDNNKSELKPAIFVNREQLAQFDPDEKMTREDGSFKSYPKDHFLYRLTGRDREKSASYYTPEVLTQCLVKYSLKELLQDKSADDILNLTVCEPAMGSAAFLNEAINQLSEVYLALKQKELGKSIPHDEYLEEKQKVKSYIANRNVFGVDLNPVAVELGEVSLWLNTIFSGGFVPWFGFQLKNGNSLIGGRRETLPISSLTSKATNPWYSQKTERIENWKNSLAINTTKVFHFFLPDPGMANYKDKVIKSLVPDSIESIKKWKTGMLKTYSSDDIDSLRKLSAAADKLWLAWVKHLADLRMQTTDSFTVFGHKEEYLHQTDMAFKDTIINKEVQSQGVKASSEYLRLKLVMDYWCALWFWPLDQTHLLPSREEWLTELSLILSDGRVNISSDSDLPLFSQTLSDERQEEYRNELGLVDIFAMIADSPRLQLVETLADQYKYFHWELEFADIFAQKGGFDLILGNPPWIKVEWNESGLMGEKEPLFAVRKLSASMVATLRSETFDHFLELKSEYLREYEGGLGYSKLSKCRYQLS